MDDEDEGHLPTLSILGTTAGTFTLNYPVMTSHSLRHTPFPHFGTIFMVLYITKLESFVSILAYIFKFNSMT